MFRSGASRSALRTIAASSKQQFTQPIVSRSFAAQIYTAGARRPQAVTIGRQLALVRLQSSKQADTVNLKEEAKHAAEKLVPHPELVSTKSSVHGITQELGVESEPHETEMLGGIKQDLVRLLY